MGVISRAIKSFLETTPVKTEDVMKAGEKTEEGRILEKQIEQKIEVTDPKLEELTDQQLAEEVAKEVDIPVGRPSDTDITASNINFDKIESDDELKQTLVNIGKMNAEFFEERGTRGLKEIEKGSKNVSLDEILGFKVGDKFTPEMIAGAKRALVISADKLVKDANKIMSGQATKADVVAFRQRVSTHVAIQHSAAGLTAESGRALNANKIIARPPKEGERSVVYESQLNEVYERLGGSDRAKDIAEFVLKYKDDLSKLNKVTRKTHNKNTKDFFLEFWINSILSNPTTHFVNMISNAATATWAIPERLLQGGVGSIQRAMGKESEYYPEEVIGQIFGLLQGIRDGLRMSAKTLRTGEASDPMVKAEMENYRTITAANLGVKEEGLLQKGIDFMGNVFRLPGRFLASEDEFFKAIGYRMELNAMAYRKAKQEGLSGEEFSKRVVELINNPTDEIHLSSQNFARVQTFTNELGDLGKSIQNTANKRWYTKMILPFVRTPANVAKYALNRSSLRAINPKFYREIVGKEGPEAQATAIAQFGLGNMVLFSTFNYALEGKITGAGPRDKKSRQALMLTGWQPYSVLVGDKYISYNRADPFGMLLAMSADVADVYSYSSTYEGIDTLGVEDPYYEMVYAATTSIVKNLSSKTFLEGVANFTEVINDPDRYAGQFAERQITGVLPFTSLMGQISRTQDPVLRDATGAEWWESYTNQIKARIPGLSENLPPRRNYWGEVITREGLGLGPAMDFINPFYTKTKKFDKVANELLDNKVGANMPPRYITRNRAKVNLTPQEYSDLTLYLGQEHTENRYNFKTGAYENMNLYQAFVNEINSPEYKRKDEVGEGTYRHKALRRIKEGYRRKGTQRFLENNPDIKKRWQDNKDKNEELTKSKITLEDLIQ